MSYILDALRKSETERSQDTTPNLLTVQHARRRPPTALLWSLIAILALNAVLIGAWLWRPGAPHGTTVGAPSSGAPPPTHEIDQPDRARIAQPSAVARPVPAEAPSVPADVPAPSDSDTVVDAAEPERSDSLEVSSHVYSADPRTRAITIAGHRFQEGDEIASGLRLVEITETGIVVDDHGARRTIDVLNGWH